MTAFERIELFNAQRGLLDNYNKENEIEMLREELVEYIDAEDIFEEVDALCDIIVVATGSLLKLGYDPTIAMEQTCKEILSRKGSIDANGKFQKDRTTEWYKADYSRALNDQNTSKKEYICMEENVQDTQKKIRQWLSTGYRIDILFQFATGNGLVITSLYKIKGEVMKRMIKEYPSFKEVKDDS